ncbi:MAG TPA: TRAP transporter small permease [Spirochaetia bacterium]|nr:TRAP transporter small permease [Spirochaetales bacterium]HRY79889.1 TRAP transporter small permease [Spirochaetia bacterium]
MSSATERRGAQAPFLHAASDAVNLWSERFLFVLMLAMVGVTTAQVVFRFFFQALTWSEELSCFLLVLASLVGSAVAFKKGSHIAVTFIADRLPETGRRLLATLVHLLGLVFFLIVAYYGAVLMKSEAGQTTPALQISMKWVYLMYPVAGAATALHLLDGMFRVWTGGES